MNDDVLELLGYVTPKMESYMIKEGLLFELELEPLCPQWWNGGLRDFQLVLRDLAVECGLFPSFNQFNKAAKQNGVRVNHNVYKGEFVAFEHFSWNSFIEPTILLSHGMRIYKFVVLRMPEMWGESVDLWCSNEECHGHHMHSGICGKIEGLDEDMTEEGLKPQRALI